MPGLEATSYHRRLRDALARDEPGLFRWYASDAYEEERTDRMRLELLRASYRLSPETHERAHRLAREAAAAVGVEVPVVLYQLHRSESANAGLFFARDEAHLVLSGPLLASLEDAELKALFGHELAHHRLLTIEDGTHRATAELLEAIAAHAGAGPAFVESAARHRLWTEVLADRGAAIAAGGIEPAIACLVKVNTGLAEVSAQNYLAQAREVVAKLAAKRERRDDDSHPETAVRAIALDLWSSHGYDADRRVAPLIEGSPALETLDVLQQREIEARTRHAIDTVLSPGWMRTDRTLAHARSFFPEYTWRAPAGDDGATTTPEALGEYLGYVLLDFAVIDPALEDVSLAQALAAARGLGVGDAFVELAKKELKKTASALNQLAERASSLFARAAETHAASQEEAAT